MRRGRAESVPADKTFFTLARCGGARQSWLRLFTDRRSSVIAAKIDVQQIYYIEVDSRARTHMQHVCAMAVRYLAVTIVVLYAIYAC